MKRRDLLAGVAAGWGLAGRTDGGHASQRGTRPAGTRPSRRSGPSRTPIERGSLRSIAGFMDSDAGVRRLYGNGPPFDDDRPRPWAVSDLTFTRALVDSDSGRVFQSEDPPKTRAVRGPVDLEAIEDKVSYDDIVYLDAPEGTAPSGTTHLDGGESHSSQDVYEYNLFFSDYTAYDLGMANRTHDNDSLPDGYTEKGLIESHRWISPADGTRTRRQAQGEDGFESPGRPAPGWRSLRNVVDRHREGVTHTVAWQNVSVPHVKKGQWGPQDAGVRQRRARRWGVHFTHAALDVVGMCELYSKNLLEELDGEYERFYADTDARYGKELLHDLAVVAGNRYRDEEEVKRRVVHSESHFFDNLGPAGTAVNPEGWQRVVVEVPPLPDNPKFEVIVTHLQGLVGSNNLDKKQSAKIKQLREVRDVIRRGNEDRPHRPKILMGDFNIHSRGRNGSLGESSGIERGEYYSTLVAKLAAEGMQEAWLTHGGPAPSYDTTCRREADGVCDPFSPKTGSHYRGERLDYVFVEKPRPAHDLRLDLSRAKMFSFDDGVFGVLSDHPGIRFDLLTSPAD